jgi:hypothetical protein
MQAAFIKILLGTMLIIAVVSFFWSPVLWVLVLVLPLAGMGIYDMMQEKQTIRRNFPLYGRGRWIMEEIRPFIRQYFFESETDGTPSAVCFAT